MNAKFSFTLILVVIALLAACSPVNDGISIPVDPVQPLGEESVALVPVTGNEFAESVLTESEPRLWSGEIFLSDNGSPDYEQKQPAANQKDQDACMSEDDLPRRFSGCVE